MDDTFEGTDAIIAKWTKLAEGAEEAQPTTPVIILTGEALDLSHFIINHWEPVEGPAPRPGLKSAVESGLLTESTAKEMQELVVAVSYLHQRFRSINAATLEAPVDRGLFLLSEIRACLQFLFAHEGYEENEATLARLSESHTETSTHDGLAISLEGFAYYANDFRDELARLPEFEPALLDEALVVARRLREQSSLKMSNSERDGQRRALSLRNRLITLLTERVNEARQAARFVFRHHPRLVREVGSGYERRRRARYRAAQRSDGAAGTDGAATTAEG